MRFTEQRLAGWGNCPVETCHLSQPDSATGIVSALSSGGHGSYIPRGLGRAYGDAALNQERGIIGQTRRNLFLAFDPATGMLTCQSGVTLAEIARHFLPRGWFLPTTPGTKYVTVGGAIAADVHGKNHHVDGSFGNWVREIDLLIATGDIIRCSPDRQPEIYWATIGGMGLTGVILSAKFPLRRVSNAWCQLDFHRTQNLDDTPDLFDLRAVDYRYSVAWIDCLQRGAGLGRSVVMLGDDAQREDLPPTRRRRPLMVPRRSPKSVPCFVPATFLNRWSVRAFNALYHAKHRSTRRLLDYESFFYPLDSVRGWNRVYGRRGFAQYQALFPHATARRGVRRLLELISASGQGSFLAVLKNSGTAGDGCSPFSIRDTLWRWTFQIPDPG